MDDDMMDGMIDPFDLLQEHDLHINRLIKAHNQTHQLFEQMAQQHEHMAAALNTQQNRMQKLEHLLEQLVKTI